MSVLATILLIKGIVMINRTTIFLSMFCFVFSLCSMDLSQSLVCGMVTLSHDIATCRIQSLLSFQEIARLKQVSRQCKALYDLQRPCLLLREYECSTYGCHKLAHNYYACTKALVHFARNKDQDMFNHLWVHHAVLRDNNVSEILKKQAATLQEKMDVYRKYYYKSKNIDKHLLDYSVKAIGAQNTAYATMVLSESNISIVDLVKKHGTAQKFLVDIFNVDFIFESACGLNNSDLIKVLCGKFVDVESFVYIMRYAKAALICDLINKNIVPVDSVDVSGKSLLHYAAHCGFQRVIKMLLNRGVYVNCTDRRGMTPLHYAVKHSQIDSVLALLDSNDVDVRFCDKKGKTALDYVSVKKRFLPYSPEEITERKSIEVILQSHVEKHQARPYSYSKVHSNGYQKLHI